MAETPLPLGPVAQSAFASLLLAAGVLGLVQPQLVPPLAQPAVAWSLIGVGALLDAWAVVAIVGAARRARDGTRLNSRS
ncbi:MAG: hypothetical protein RLW61_09020 [Gammaproteobacteria bacterium]